MTNDRSLNYCLPNIYYSLVSNNQRKCQVKDRILDSISRLSSQRFNKDGKKNGNQKLAEQGEVTYSSES